MKKEYIAPDLYFESFVLSESIAAGCGSTGIGLVKDFNSWGYFYTTSPDNRLDTCTEEWDDSIYESYCYWSGDDMTLFLS